MIAVIAAAVGLWYARTAILLAFAGILLAIVFYGASKALAELTKLPRLVMLAVVVLSTALFFVIVFSTAGPTLTQQIAQLARSIAVGATSLTKELASFADQSSILQNIDLVEVVGKFLSPWGIATGATSVALSIVGLFSAGLIVLFFGIYFAADPDTYVDIVARLSPPERRAAILEVMYETGNRLRRWLIGQGISMATIGTLTYIGLLILGVPIAFVLALFAGLAGFLPYLGPIIGAIPMVLVAGGESLDLALWVVGLYVIIQFLESYLLTPLIQARAVSMPPAVVILSQLVLGAVFGLLGLALATPLAAASTVPLRYIFGMDKREPAKTQTAGQIGSNRCVSCSSPALTREASYNKKLARLGQHIAEANGIEAVFVDLRDYPMPIYDGDLEAARGAAREGARIQGAARRVSGRVHREPRIQFLGHAAPQEHARLGEPGQGEGRDRARSVQDQSVRHLGRLSRLLRRDAEPANLRQILAIGLGALVIPEQIAVPRAMDAFEADGSLKDKAQQALCKSVVEALAVAARKFV